MRDPFIAVAILYAGCVISVAGCAIAAALYDVAGAIRTRGQP